ncbi:B9 domain-containing protein 2-like [Penaeus japonicus]|uniref:B9 domain-containing protein 2-like n=1 Tax=Penaeus japonicus TaxID=27405 RepID=UPI001C712736|nr:B9 domain-containing protein 2-like [Penaeus japonicus]
MRTVPGIDDDSDVYVVTVTVLCRTVRKKDWWFRLPTILLMLLLEAYESIPMAEVHVIGQITGASGFGRSSLFCKWTLQLGGGWRVIEGLAEGQTQADCSEVGDTVSWCHPVDIHLATRGIQGWPRLMVQVYRQDDLGRFDLCGYGIIHIPSRPGHHSVDCPTWRPTGTFAEELRRSFLGGGPQLLSTEFIHSGLERYRLRTIPSGTVRFDLGIILRNFDKYGVMY